MPGADLDQVVELIGHQSPRPFSSSLAGAVRPLIGSMMRPWSWTQYTSEACSIQIRRTLLPDPCLTLLAATSLLQSPLIFDAARRVPLVNGASCASSATGSRRSSARTLWDIHTTGLPWPWPQQRARMPCLGFLMSTRPATSCGVPLLCCSVKSPASLTPRPRPPSGATLPWSSWALPLVLLVWQHRPESADESPPQTDRR